MKKFTGKQKRWWEKIIFQALLRFGPQNKLAKPMLIDGRNSGSKEKKKSLGSLSQHMEVIIIFLKMHFLHFLTICMRVRLLKMNQKELKFIKG